MCPELLVSGRVVGTEALRQLPSGNMSSVSAACRSARHAGIMRKCQNANQLHTATCTYNAYLQLPRTLPIYTAASNLHTRTFSLWDYRFLQGVSIAACYADALSQLCKHVRLSVCVCLSVTLCCPIKTVQSRITKSLSLPEII